MRLMRMGLLLRKEYHLYSCISTNYFTSIPLINELALLKTHITGTVWTNFKGLRRGVKQKLQVCEIVTDKIRLFREKKSQKNAVLLVSTKNKADTQTLSLCRSSQAVPSAGDALPLIVKFVTVLDYNKHMGEFDAGMTSQQYRKFIVDWNVFCTMTDLPDVRMHIQLYSCADNAVQCAIISTYPDFLSTPVNIT